MNITCWLLSTAEYVFTDISRPSGHRQISNVQNWGDPGTVKWLTVCVLWVSQPRGEQSWITYRNKWGTNWLSQSWAAAQEDVENQRLLLLIETRGHKITQKTHTQLCTQAPPPPRAAARDSSQQYCLFNLLPRGQRWSTASGPSLLRSAAAPLLLNSQTLCKHEQPSDTINPPHVVLPTPPHKEASAPKH